MTRSKPERGGGVGGALLKFDGKINIRHNYEMVLNKLVLFILIVINNLNI